MTANVWYIFFKITTDEKTADNVPQIFLSMGANDAIVSGVSRKTAYVASHRSLMRRMAWMHVYIEEGIS
ncbi:MAG: hypothetical protein WA081_13275 [Desulfosalsimonadaceae bacterium]